MERLQVEAAEAAHSAAAVRQGAPVEALHQSRMSVAVVVGQSRLLAAMEVVR